MAGMFQGDESKFAPSACEFWQANRIPRSPLYPRPQFLRWFHTDSEENYRKRGNKAFSVESVGYEFNSLGYRGPEFNRERGEAVVMFLGDSHTLGLGMPWERLWTSLVTKHLEQRWGVPVRQCNLGFGGTGADYTAMMVHQSVDVLKPDAVFILWSFVSRMTWFADTRRRVHFVAEWAPDKYTQEHSAYLRLATESHGFFNYVRNFHLVRDRLLRLGIPYYWGNFEQFSREMLEPYLPLDGFAGCWKGMDLARDGLHGGLKSHAFFAASVISTMERGALSRPRANWLSTAEAARAVAVPYGAISRRTSALDRIKVLVPRPIRELIGNLRVRRRVRAMKRKDPFIY
jgi:hypothetical protein